MCNSTLNRAIDPAKLLTGNSAKWADPLGITQTAVGDPTGQNRRNTETERVRQDARNGGPERRAAVDFHQRQLTAQKALQPAPKTILGG